MTRGVFPLPLGPFPLFPSASPGTSSALEISGDGQDQLIWVEVTLDRRHHLIAVDSQELLREDIEAGHILHLYDVHLSPRNFPMSSVWLSGKMPLEKTERYHRREYERLTQEARQSEE